MQAFTTHKGLAAILDKSNVDTDQIIPKQFLSKVTKDGFGVHLFHDWRYLDDLGKHENPDFILNQQPYKQASILITGKNFGCGSSREHAPWALADFGLRVIIAPSFADIFYNNALNNGLLPVKLSETQIQILMKDVKNTLKASIKVNLTDQSVISPRGQSFTFTISPSAKHNLLHGLDPIGLTLENQQQIALYESNIPCWRR